MDGGFQICPWGVPGKWKTSSMSHHHRITITDGESFRLLRFFRITFFKLPGTNE